MSSLVLGRALMKCHYATPPLQHGVTALLASVEVYRPDNAQVVEMLLASGADDYMATQGEGVSRCMMQRAGTESTCD